MTTPFEQKGWKATDKFRVVDKKHGHRFKIGEIVTLYYDDGTPGPRFIDCEGRKWFCEFSELERIEPEWNGEGLPPVGSRFEYGSHRSEALCIAVSYHHIFASKGDPNDEDGDYEEFLIEIQSSSFRPIRSERDKAVDDMLKMTPNINNTIYKHIMGRLYDAGYRKV